jgi:hypothetical protein
MALLPETICRLFATAGKTGKKGAAQTGKNAKPAKQKLMGKQKQTAARSSSAGHGSNADRVSRLTDALFPKPDVSRSEMGTDEHARRTLIAKGWSKWRMLQEHAASNSAARFLRSKLNAVAELQSLSPILAEKAMQISYDPAPQSIKPAAETPPARLPFQ